MGTKIIVTLTGPSLTGKSTLETLLEKKGFQSLVTSTSRPQRSGEENGVHYYFISADEFKKGIDSDAFVEHVLVDGNYYGLSKAEIERALESGTPTVMVCEPNGANAVARYAQEMGLHHIKVFIDNPIELLMKRFLERFKADEKATSSQYAKRLANMIGIEREQWVQRAHNGQEHYDLLIDNFLEETSETTVQQIITLCQNDLLRPKKKITIKSSTR